MTTINTMDATNAFHKTHLNMFDVQSEYRARQRQPAAAPGKKPIHRSETGELLLNPNPLLFQQELQRRVEVFENLKVTYLEQETKEKFLRSLLNDPPQLVEQHDLENIRAENKDKKAILKQNKIRLSDLQSQLTEGSRELCMEYENLQSKVHQSIQMNEEMQEMAQEIEALSKQQEALELPKYDDPDMNLPAPELDELSKQYKTQMHETDDAYNDLVQNALPQVEQEQQQLEHDIQRLTRERAQVESKAEELVNQQKNKSQLANESTAKWYRSMITLMEKTHGIHIIQENQGGDDEEEDGYNGDTAPGSSDAAPPNRSNTIKLTAHGHDYVIQLDRNTGMVTQATISNVDQALVDQVVSSSSCTIDQLLSEF